VSNKTSDYIITRANWRSNIEIEGKGVTCTKIEKYTASLAALIVVSGNQLVSVGFYLPASKFLVLLYSRIDFV
jgi:hypothetical protein